VKIKIFVKGAIGAGIGKIDRLFRFHGDKDLDQGKQTGKDPLACVFFDLMTGLADRHAAFLQLNLNNRHTVNEQQQITPTVAQYF